VVYLSYVPYCQVYREVRTKCLLLPAPPSHFSHFLPLPALLCPVVPFLPLLFPFLQFSLLCKIFPAPSPRPSFTLVRARKEPHSSNSTQC
jgi:hypothetical protein